ncbi:NAD-dependent protein deacetylase sirtuin-2 [Rhizoclosmatium hyalinum]|nr:NAD-dependent protein deacetylase sirtuin-2 [Rhizoclosmatium hyalinum]
MSFKFWQSKPALSPLEKKRQNPDLNILEDETMDSFVHYLKDHQCKKIVVMTGAGISTSAGIPDFRSPTTGLYANLAKYNLPYPEAVFSINYFRKSPKPFFTLAKELYPGCFKPTLCHYFIRLLADEGMLLRCYTQNIDTLERVAGLNENYLVEAHGSFASAKCVGKHRKPITLATNTETETETEEGSSTENENNNNNDDDSSSDDFVIDESEFRACGKEYSQEWVKEHVFGDKIPECTACQGLVKPNITFFGESLPNRFHAMYPTDLINADALIVIGTSLKVHPFAGLINKVREKVPRLLMNMEVVGVEGSPYRGFDFTGENQEYRRDALFVGGADDGCLKLAEMLGLGDKLKAMVKAEHAKIDLLNGKFSATDSTIVVPEVKPEFVSEAAVKMEVNEAVKEESVAQVASEVTETVEVETKPIMAVDDVSHTLENLKL